MAIDLAAEKQLDVTMRFSNLVGGIAATLVLSEPALASSIIKRGVVEKRAAPIAPKFMIISMFGPEGEAWYGIPEFDVSLLYNAGT